MDKTSFHVCVRTNFIRENPEVILGILFTLSQLILWNPSPSKRNWYHLKIVSREPPQIMTSMDYSGGDNAHFVIGSGSPTFCYLSLKHPRLAS